MMARVGRARQSRVRGRWQRLSGWTSDNMKKIEIHPPRRNIHPIAFHLFVFYFFERREKRLWRFAADAPGGRSESVLYVDRDERTQEVLV